MDRVRITADQTASLCSARLPGAGSGSGVGPGRALPSGSLATLDQPGPLRFCRPGVCRRFARPVRDVRIRCQLGRRSTGRGRFQQWLPTGPGPGRRRRRFPGHDTSGGACGRGDDIRAVCTNSRGVTRTRACSRHPGWPGLAGSRARCCCGQCTCLATRPAGRQCPCLFAADYGSGPKRHRHGVIFHRTQPGVLDGIRHSPGG